MEICSVGRVEEGLVASLLLLGPAGHAQAPGPLHLWLPLPGMFLPQVSARWASFPPVGLRSNITFLIRAPSPPVLPTLSCFVLLHRTRHHLTYSVFHLLHMLSTSSLWNVSASVYFVHCCVLETWDSPWWISRTH